MKIIFLDVDGVLNHAGTEARSPSGYVGVVDKHVKQLKHIVNSTNAILVLTSTWRHEIDDMTLKGVSAEGSYLTKKLKKAGLHLRGKTSKLISDINRYESILEWIKTHVIDGELEAWCVIDDDVFPGYLNDKDFKKRFVKTSYATGLTDELVDKAIRILNNQFGDGDNE